MLISSAYLQLVSPITANSAEQGDGKAKRGSRVCTSSVLFRPGGQLQGNNNKVDTGLFSCVEKVNILTRRRDHTHGH